MKKRDKASSWAKFSQGLTFFLYATAALSGLAGATATSSRKESSHCILPDSPPLLYPKTLIHSAPQGEYWPPERALLYAVTHKPPQPKPDPAHGLQIYKCAIKAQEVKQLQKSNEYFDYLTEHYAVKIKPEHPYKNSLPFNLTTHHLYSPHVANYTISDAQFLITLHQMLKEYTQKISNQGPYAIEEQIEELQNKGKLINDPALDLIHYQHTLILWSSELIKKRIAKEHPNLTDQLHLNPQSISKLFEVNQNYIFEHENEAMSEKFSSKTGMLIMHRLQQGYQNYFYGKSEKIKFEPESEKQQPDLKQINTDLALLVLGAIPFGLIASHMICGLCHSEPARPRGFNQKKYR